MKEQQQEDQQEQPDHHTTTTSSSTKSQRPPPVQSISVDESTGIVLRIGYAFGPKKLKSMKTVLAEASKTIIWECDHEEDDDDEEEQQQEGQPLTQKALAAKAEQEQHAQAKSTTVLIDGPSSTTTGSYYSYSSTQESDVQQIVRYLQTTACSSIAEEEEEEYCCDDQSSFASIPTVTSATTGTTSYHTPQKYSTNKRTSTTTSKNSSMNNKTKDGGGIFSLSFVPLDLDQPVQPPCDLMIHKLTEDILLCSLHQDEQEQNDDGDDTLLQGAKTRIQRLMSMATSANNTNAKVASTNMIIDPPNIVQPLMSRSKIAHILQSCLTDVTSTSGYKVAAPKFVVVPPATSVERLHQWLDDAQMSVPLIAKPDIAAGTKESHYMSIVLGESPGLHDLLLSRHQSGTSSPMVLQEYVNHNATLYKVYVLGGRDQVFCYRRQSLPNLPQNSQKGGGQCVQFDSQRPYPQFQDLCGCTGEGGKDNDVPDNQDDDHDPDDIDIPITATEVQPIVDCLRHAFGGLELFGFDVIVSSKRRQLLVVDVNYFPSYKEVPDFPSLLAQYLLKRVLQARRMEWNTAEEEQSSSCCSCSPTSSLEQHGGRIS